MIFFLVPLIKNITKVPKQSVNLENNKILWPKIKNNSQKTGEMNAEAGSEFSQVSGNYHEQRGPYGVSKGQNPPFFLLQKHGGQSY